MQQTEWVVTCTKDSYSLDRRGGDPVFVIRDGLIPMRHDARLITAAPDLLAALIETREALHEWANQSGISKSEHGHRSRVVNECEAAIAKATGGET